MVDTVHSGEIFGWSSMVTPPGRWTATARCATPCRIISMPAADLKALLKENPDVGYAFMGRLVGVVSQRLHSWTEKLIEAWGEAFDVHPG